MRYWAPVRRGLLSLIVVALVAATTAGGLSGALGELSRSLVSVTGRMVGEPGVARSVVELSDGSPDDGLHTAGPAIPLAVPQTTIVDPNDANESIAANEASPDTPSGEVDDTAHVYAGETEETHQIASSDPASLVLGIASQDLPELLEEAPVAIPQPTSASTTSSAPTTSAPATSRAPATTAAPATTRAPATTVAPATTRAPATTVAPATTRAPATTVAPTTTRAPASNGIGCQTNCRTVGLQNLDGQSGVTLQNLIITNPGGRCLSLVGARDITIKNVTIRDCGTERAVDSHYDTGLILIVDARNIIIEKSLIENMSNERFGSKRNNAIQIGSSSNVTIRSSKISKIRSDITNNSDDRGSRAIKIEGSSSNIRIEGNTFSDAGRNAVQVNRVRDASGIAITNNVIAGRGRWDSDYEDMINLYSSSGTASSPIRVSGNTMRNGGPSRTGTGIILGDGASGSGPSRHIVVENNVMRNPGHVGINLAGGDHITVRNNTIVGTGSVPLATTVGMTINDFGYAGACRDHVVTGNRVWMDNQHLPDGTNHLWNPGTCTNNVRIEGNTFGDASLR